MRMSREEEDVCSDWLHQDAVMHGPHQVCARARGRIPQHEATVAEVGYRRLFGAVRPGLSIEDPESHAAPLEVISAMCVPIDLYVHHNRARLLDLPDLPELDSVTEADREIASGCKGAEISGRHAWENEEDSDRAHQNQSD